MLSEYHALCKELGLQPSVDNLYCISGPTANFHNPTAEETHRYIFKEHLLIHRCFLITSHVRGTIQNTANNIPLLDRCDWLLLHTDCDVCLLGMNTHGLKICMRMTKMFSMLSKTLYSARLKKKFNTTGCHLQ